MNLIPLPVSVEARAGAFELTPSSALVADEASQGSAAALRVLIAPPTGFPLPIQVGPAGAGDIVLRVNPELGQLGGEGYHLQVAPQGVVLEACTPAGIFYAIQTLRQLLPANIESRQLVPHQAWRIPCVEVSDHPRFAWRGFMLDEGRHFHGKPVVLHLLELMALHKLNIFHWHLTDDQGWRIQVNAFPRLTEVGAQRAGTSRGVLGKHDRVPHDGFYTQEDIRQVVAFAAERHITIVPEIELPGHSLAALAAYPQLSCSGGPFEVATHFGVFPDVYCAGKEEVFAFLKSVLDEVLELFPSPYIHIGGDEVPKRRWKACPHCQRRIGEQGLKDEHALQVYFTNRILDHLAQRGRRGIGWNQILDAGLAKDAVVQYWLGSRPRLLHAIQHEQRPVVMSSFLDTYLDHSYSLTPLSRAYRYAPIPPELDETQAERVLGLEFPLWGEYVRSRARLDYQAFPRLTALAETAWTPEALKDLPGFRQRLSAFLPRLDALGVAYAPLTEVEPSWLRQRLGMFSLAIPQTRISSQRHAERKSPNLA